MSFGGTHMGTLADWMNLLGVAVFLGGLSASILAVGRWLHDLRFLPYLSATELLCCFAIGLSFGIFSRFNWAAFQKPLVLVELPLLVLAAVILLAIANSRPNRSA